MSVEGIEFPPDHSAWEAGWLSLGKLGRGRFGEVSLTQHVSSGRKFALKQTRSAGASEVHKMEIEALALSRLSHEHVISHYAAWHHDDPVYGSLFFILMELADEGDFGSLLEERWACAKAEGASWLGEEEVMGWFVQLAEGLAHVHSKRVLHRDLKPENIFVFSSGVLKIGRCLFLTSSSEPPSALPPSHSLRCR